MTTHGRTYPPTKDFCLFWSFLGASCACSAYLLLQVTLKMRRVRRARRVHHASTHALAPLPHESPLQDFVGREKHRRKSVSLAFSHLPRPPVHHPPARRQYHSGRALGRPTLQVIRTTVFIAVIILSWSRKSHNPATPTTPAPPPPLQWSRHPSFTTPAGSRPVSRAGSTR